MVNRVDRQPWSCSRSTVASPAVITGAGQRVASSAAPAAADAPGTRTVSLDLAAVERELGLPDDPSNVAMSVDRALAFG